MKALYSLQSIRRLIHRTVMSAVILLGRGEGSHVPSPPRIVYAEQGDTSDTLSASVSSSSSPKDLSLHRCDEGRRCGPLSATAAQIAPSLWGDEPRHLRQGCCLTSFNSRVQINHRSTDSCTLLRRSRCSTPQCSEQTACCAPTQPVRSAFGPAPSPHRHARRSSPAMARSSLIALTGGGAFAVRNMYPP
ncbi:hypothetical protein BD413DRAFT_136883 [Trametes elegans]|nr:hypothetical protein BD413DRAFT_136883 [Trametes elegans]